MGTRGGEDSRGCGRTETGRVWENGAGSLTTSRPCGPTFTHRKTRTNGEEQSRPRNPGLQPGK